MHTLKNILAFSKPKVMRTDLYSYHRYINSEAPNQFVTSMQQKEGFAFLVSLRNQRNIPKKAPFAANTKSKEKRCLFWFFWFFRLCLLEKHSPSLLPLFFFFSAPLFRSNGELGAKKIFYITSDS